MEKKQLNFSAPIISARRYSSPLRSSGEDLKRDSLTEDRNPILSQQSDLHLGEVVKPGSVPFIWEQAPGKAKDGIDSQSTSPEEMPSTPKLPISMPFPPGKKSGELNGYRTPNKLSGELHVLKQRSMLSGELQVPRPQHRFSGELNTLKSHKLSGELNTFRQHNKFSGELSSLCKYSSSNDGMVRWDSSKDGTEMNESSKSEDDSDGTFSDVIGALSQRGSFSVNCSISGLSGSERAETNASALITTDPRTRDFMINRFLPAAKAMTIEPSQYVSRKQHQLVVVEQPMGGKTPPPSHNVCHIVPYTGQDIGSEESEDDEDSFDGRSNLSIKVKSCGFLPWLCTKNALRFMNPLPAMKDKSRSALSSASKVSNLIKNKSWISPSHKMPKDSQHHKNHRVAPAFKSCELQKPKLTTRPMFYSGELETRSGSPYRGSRRSSVSPYRNESPPPSLYQKGVGFLPVPKNVDSYDDYKAKVSNKGSKRHDDPRRNTRGLTSPVTEKTLYIDSVNIPKVSHSLMNVSKTKRQVNGSAKSGPLYGSTKSGPLYGGLRSGSSFQHGGRVEMMNARGMSGPLICGGTGAGEPYFGSVNTRPSKISGYGNVNTCRELVVVDDDYGMSASLTPPLPKSPSESWLSRQLPSVSPRVSPRNSVTYTSMNSKILSRKQNGKTAPGAKWETIVKSSHLRQDHGRYSEELVTHVNQQSRVWK